MKLHSLIQKPSCAITGDIGHRTFHQVYTIYNDIIYDGYKELTIFINSLGGCCATCSAIVFLLRDLKKQGVHITTIGSGNVASAGAIIFMEGDHRYCMPDVDFMVHKPAIYNFGSLTEAELEERLKEIQKKSIWDDYIKKIKLTKAQKKLYDGGKDVTFSPYQMSKNGILTGRLT